MDLCQSNRDGICPGILVSSASSLSEMDGVRSLFGGGAGHRRDLYRPAVVVVSMLSLSYLLHRRTCLRCLPVERSAVPPHSRASNPPTRPCPADTWPLCFLVLLRRVGLLRVFICSIIHGEHVEDAMSRSMSMEWNEAAEAAQSASTSCMHTRTLTFLDDDRRTRGKRACSRWKAEKREATGHS